MPKRKPAPDEAEESVVADPVEAAETEVVDTGAAEVEETAADTPEPDETVEATDETPVVEAEPTEEPTEEVSGEDESSEQEPAAEDPVEAPETEDVVKSGGRRLKVRGFFGTFKNACFVEDETRTFGVAENVDDVTFNALQNEFPEAEIHID